MVDFLDILLALQMEIMSNDDKHQNPKQVLGVISPVTVTPRLSCWLFNVFLLLCSLHLPLLCIDHTRHHRASSTVPGASDPKQKGMASVPMIRRPNRACHLIMGYSFKWSQNQIRSMIEYHDFFSSNQMLAYNCKCMGGKWAKKL